MANSAALSPVVRRYLVSIAVSRVGTGLTLPFTLILLHEVRGIALPTVGLLLALPAVVGLAAVPFSGSLVDRIGPRAVLRGCLVLQALGTTGTVLAHTPAQALPALLLTGLGLGPSFPAGNALLTGLVDDPAQASRAFGVQFTVINAAIGVGPLIGAAVVDVHRAATFVVLYLTCSLTCLVECALLPPAVRRVIEHDEVPASYGEVLRDPVFRQVCLISLLLAMTGYAALDSGLPAFARVEGGVPPSTIALAYTVNTVLIVGLQLPVLRWITAWRRTRALAVAGVLWALSWALLGLAHSAAAVLAFAEGEWAGRVTGLGNQSGEVAMMRTPDGHNRLELSRFLDPVVVADHRNAPIHSLGYLRVMFAVDDLDDTLDRLQDHGAQLVSSEVVSTKTRTDSATSGDRRDSSSD